MGVEIVVIAILIFAVVTVWKGVRIVPQDEDWIVERLGKFNATRCRRPARERQA
jgi:regulator of protease activity HflC (stomatin/prohibitin superfamily)